MNAPSKHCQAARAFKEKAGGPKVEIIQNLQIFLFLPVGNHIPLFVRMFFQPVELTTALRPLLLPDEILLFVQDAVGLYEGYVFQSYSTWNVHLTNSMIFIGNTKSLPCRMVMLI